MNKMTLIGSENLGRLGYTLFRPIFSREKLGRFSTIVQQLAAHHGGPATRAMFDIFVEGGDPKFDGLDQNFPYI